MKIPTHSPIRRAAPPRAARRAPAISRGAIIPLPAMNAPSGACSATRPPRPRVASPTCHLLAAGLIFAPAAMAEHPSPAMARSLAELSIEQLLNESVTSVSRREARWMDTPAAITVLTGEEIERSGATSLVDALRLVPGLYVGAMNSGQTAISARGFNMLYSNKMLVQIDGRPVYNPVFAGVFWDVQQPMLEDVDRIEVIRGPGASVWGANAVNGVISVVSRSARETQGGFVYGGGGNVHEALGGFRYGGRIGEGETYYRVFGNYRLEDDFLLPGGRSAGDAWETLHGGFRLDSYRGADTHLTWQADFTGIDTDDGTETAYNANSIVRWTRDFAGGSSVEVQAFYDRAYRDDAMRAYGVVDTFDLGAQHSFSLGGGHDLMWGVGYRRLLHELRQTNPGVPVFDRSFDLNLFSAFVQDEFEMVPERFRLISGLKLEHNDYTGFELQPSLRALYTPTPDHTFWAAVSRAVRTPSAIEGGRALGYVAGPPTGGVLPLVLGAGNGVDSEILWAYELGYRTRPTQWATLDIAAFYNDYSDVIGQGNPTGTIPAAPFPYLVMPMDNLIRGETYGGEISLTLHPSESWRLITSYSLLLGHFEGRRGADASSIAREFPNHQVVLRSSHDLNDKTNLDIQFRYVDQVPNVPAYLTADVRLAYRPHPDFEVALVGQNLLDDQHPEHFSVFSTPNAEVPRGYYAKLTWNF